MLIEKISLKTLTIGVVLIPAIAAITSTWWSETVYRQAALQTQTDNAARILQVASDAALQHLANESQQLAAAAAKALAHQPDLENYLAEAPAGTRNPVLAKLLEAPLNTDLDMLKPISVQLYNRARERLMGAGPTLSADTPVLQEASADSAAAAFWLSAEGAHYSIVQPVGEKAGRGYLEIRFDPAFTLQKAAALTHLPLRIDSLSDDALYEIGEWDSGALTSHEITHTVTDDYGTPMLKLRALDDFSSLYHATRETRHHTTLAFAAAGVATLLLVFLVLHHFLFKPAKILLEDMRQVARGEMDSPVKGRAPKEFRAVAGIFNDVVERIRDIIEREQKITEQVSGKVELIRDVVSMATRGNLTGQIMPFRERDTVSELATGIQEMLDSLNSQVARIQQSGIQVSSSADEIAAAARQQEASATEQAVVAHQIKTEVTQITVTSRELAKRVQNMTELASQASAATLTSRTSLQDLEDVMQQVTEAAQSIGARLSVLDEKAASLHAVATTVGQVAEQTRLLSLNAAIEAEKATDSGYGYSIVADEMRRLADHSALVSRDIEQMLSEMHSTVSSGMKGVEHFSQVVQHGKQHAHEVNYQLCGMIEQVEALMPRLQEINEALSSQAQGGEQIQDCVGQLSESVWQTAAAVRRSSGTILQLNHAAQRLQEGTSHFRVTASG